MITKPCDSLFYIISASVTMRQVSVVRLTLLWLVAIGDNVILSMASSNPTKAHDDWIPAKEEQKVQHGTSIRHFQYASEGTPWNASPESSNEAHPLLLNANSFDVKERATARPFDSFHPTNKEEEDENGDSVTKLSRVDRDLMATGPYIVERFNGGFANNPDVLGPPRASGAVGPQKIVLALGSGVGIYDKAGTSRFDYAEFTPRFSQILYDPHAQRFVLCVLNGSIIFYTSRAAMIHSLSMDPFSSHQN